MKEAIRKKVLDLGADVCGFAGIERFIEAPAGFHPYDLYRDCQVVVVMGFALPKGLYEVKPDLLYGYFNNLTIPKIDQILMMAARIIEDTYNATAVPVPCDWPYDYWNSEEMEGRGLISMKHAAVNAGLGTMGKNTMLLNEAFGNRLTVGAILSDLKITSDSYAEPLCLEGCTRCLTSCPAQALNEGTVTQKLCRRNTYGTNAKGFETVLCNTCRSVCPVRFGKTTVIG